MREPMQTTAGTMRPGLASRPVQPEQTRGERREFDPDAIRERLIAASIFEVADALDATTDELCRGLAWAIDRIAGRTDDIACPQCGRFSECNHSAGSRFPPCCSRMCADLFTAHA